MKICGLSFQLGLRGTEVAEYDYFNWLEKLYDYDVMFLSKHPSIQPFTHPLGIKKFEDRFGKDKIFYYYDFHKDGEEILKNNNVDYLYCIKCGENDNIYSKNPNIKTGVHAVFQYYQPHGFRYKYISKWLSDLYGGVGYVPHMVDLPNVDGDLREKLEIPKEALVFLRYGGIDTFNIQYVRDLVYDIVRKRNDIYFVFMYTEKFCPDHKQIIHLDGNSDLNFKVKLINTCDAGLHARLQGESWGLFNMEISALNKPNITWNNGRDQAHLQLLGDKCYRYNDYQDLYNIIMNFEPQKDKDWNAYRDYTPEKVVQIFKKEFLD